MLGMIVGATRVETDRALDQLPGLGEIVSRKCNHSQQEIGVGVVWIEIEDTQTRGMRAAQIRTIQAGLGLSALLFDGLNGAFDLLSRLFSERIAEFYTERARPQHVAEISA
jgi:hypothetical protein